MWVGIDDGLCFCACQLYNLSVSCNIGYLQVESHSALLGSFQIARSSELEIGFGDAESIVRITHDINAFAGFLRQLIVGDEDAVTLVATSSHSASELVELGKSEALCIEDNHHGGIGHIHTHFYHGGGYQYLRLALHEMLHFFFLLCRFHLSVYLTEAELREGFLQRFKSFL